MGADGYGTGGRAGRRVPLGLIFRSEGHYDGCLPLFEEPSPAVFVDLMEFYFTITHILLYS